MGKRRTLLKEHYDKEWQDQFRSSLPRNPTPEELKEWEWQQQEKQRPKVINHDWMFEEWLRSKERGE